MNLDLPLNEAQGSGNEYKQKEAPETTNQNQLGGREGGLETASALTKTTLYLPDSRENASPKRPAGRIIVHSRNTNSQLRDVKESTPKEEVKNAIVFIRDM